LAFSIQPGEIFGFLGPSGAGKSTTQKILIGLLCNYRGHVSVMDKDLKCWRSDYNERIGVSFEIPNHYQKLTWTEILTINAFFFMVALVLLEKGEGTLEAQIVTPPRTWEYLLSKVISLGILAIFESLILIVIVSGAGFNWLWMILGILALMAIYSLYGFFVVSRYDSINEFLLPSVLWTIAYSLPLLYYFDIWNSWLLFLHPMQAPLVLMQAAFQTLPTWQVIYGLLEAGNRDVWIYGIFGILYLSFLVWLSIRHFNSIMHR
jgi:hypothetical protein